MATGRRASEDGKSPLKLATLCTELRGIDWQTLAGNLGVDSVKIQTIQQQHPNNVSRCMMDMLDHWTNNGEDVSWAHVAFALKKMFKVELAERISMRYCSNIATDSPGGGGGGGGCGGGRDRSNSVGVENTVVDCLMDLKLEYSHMTSSLYRLILCSINRSILKSRRVMAKNNFIRVLAGFLDKESHKYNTIDQIYDELLADNNMFLLRSLKSFVHWYFHHMYRTNHFYAERLISAYERKKDKFMSSVKLKQLKDMVLQVVPEEGLIESKHECLTLVLKEKCGDCTLKMLERLMFDVFGIHSSVCIIFQVIHGSIIVKWQFREEFKQLLIDLAFGKLEVLKENDVTELSIGKEVVYPPIHIQEYMTVEEQQMLLSELLSSMTHPPGSHPQNQLEPDDPLRGVSRVDVEYFRSMISVESDLDAFEDGKEEEESSHDAVTLAVPGRPSFFPNIVDEKSTCHKDIYLLESTAPFCGVDKSLPTCPLPTITVDDKTLPTCPLPSADIEGVDEEDQRSGDKVVTVAFKELKEVFVSERNALLQQIMMSQRHQNKIITELRKEVCQLRNELKQSQASIILRGRERDEMVSDSVTKRCLLCSQRYRQTQLIQMPGGCGHILCTSCFVGHFSTSVKNKTAREFTCPHCGQPKVPLQDVPSLIHTFFQDLSILMRKHVSCETCDLFHEKLTEYYTQSASNVELVLCPLCQTAFVWDRKDCRVIECLNCHKYLCPHCKLLVDSRESCLNEQCVKTRALLNSSIESYLRNITTECPSCQAEVSLNPNQSDQLQCSVCHSTFCPNCQEPFNSAKECCRLSSCKDKGLHVHHLRNCYYYLKDFPNAMLEKLLIDNNTHFESSDNTELSVAGSGRDHCARKGCAKERQESSRLCSFHYKDYLVSRIREEGLDPADVSGVKELLSVLQREGISPLKQSTKVSPLQYRLDLVEQVKDQLPLDDPAGSFSQYEPSFRSARQSSCGTM